MTLSFKVAKKIPTKSDVDDWENQIGIKLPDNYKLFLLTVNGGSKPNRSRFQFKDSRYEYSDSSLRTLYSFEDNYDEDGLKENYEIYVLSNRVPQSMLPIGEDYFGNLICISTGGNDIGKVYFWNHEEEGSISNSLHLLAENFDEFIFLLKAQ